MAITPFTNEEKIAWHNKLPGKPCGAAMICLNSDKKMLAVKASYKDYWTVPGGVVDESESPQAAALRELKEEAGIVLAADSIRFADLVYHGPWNGMSDFMHFLFLAENIDAEFTPDGHEIMEIKWVTPVEFRTMCDERTHLMRAADIAEGLNLPLYLEENT